MRISRGESRVKTRGAVDVVVLMMIMVVVMIVASVMVVVVVNVVIVIVCKIPLFHRSCVHGDCLPQGTRIRIS